ncbi:hypothetical protein LCGC14_1301500 [marine sediment metagenome]|uniref:Uncharacterized protein n=1 Tax=marine sediment metagenome TaxID=412755 RepID=A0A0F9NSD7_9ZZZZ
MIREILGYICIGLIPLITIWYMKYGVYIQVKAWSLK